MFLVNQSSNKELEGMHALIVECRSLFKNSNPGTLKVTHRSHQIMFNVVVPPSFILGACAISLMCERCHRWSVIPVSKRKKKSFVLGEQVFPNLKVRSCKVYKSNVKIVLFYVALRWHW